MKLGLMVVPWKERDFASQCLIYVFLLSHYFTENKVTFALKVYGCNLLHDMIQKKMLYMQLA